VKQKNSARLLLRSLIYKLKLVLFQFERHTSYNLSSFFRIFIY
jgi:hypothetical protein